MTYKMVCGKCETIFEGPKPRKYCPACCPGITKPPLMNYRGCVYLALNGLSSREISEEIGVSRYTASIIRNATLACKEVLEDL